MKSDTETVVRGALRQVARIMASALPSSMRQKMGNAFILGLLVLAPGIAIALNLATSPLFLSNSAKPNIVFVGDDSSSMDWGLVTNESNGIMTFGTCGGQEFPYYYTHPGSTTAGVAPPASNYFSNNRLLPTQNRLDAAGYTSDGAWRAWNSSYNRLYYNPEVRYYPWEGADVDGTAFTAITASSAPYNPYRPGDGTINLTATLASYTVTYCPLAGGSSVDITISNYYPAMYYTWTDSNSNGSVDATDSHSIVEITTGAAPFAKTTSNRTDCSNTSSCIYAEEIRNFANWFSYYRKRDLAMKAAISKFVSDSSDRVAYTAINNSVSTAINISISEMNSSATSGNGRTLLKGVFSTVPNGSSTPLRDRLDAVGRYFECVTGNAFGLAAGSTDCPILTAASGGTCQQNFAVMVTDGGWDDNFDLSTYAVGDTDIDGSGSYDGGAYSDNKTPVVENTLADIAMHYYERDLQANLSNQVAVLAGVDEATHQHMVTYALALGISGNLSANPTDSTTAFSNWPTATAVTTSTAAKIDDLRHAAYNGRGEFLSVFTPDALRTELSGTKVSIGGRSGSAAAVAVNSRSLSTSTRLYQARFESSEWSGDLRALTIDTSGTVGSEVWSAKEQLKSQNWNTGRVIYTRNATTGTGITFRWNTTNLSAIQQSDLSANVPTGWTTDNWGTARLNWLRGDSSNEGTGSTNFRKRTDGFKLGDIVNSTPIFVGAPPYLADIDSGTHTTFRTNYTTRTEMIYVGANDGMLHGFDASTGQEKIAYLPSMVFSSSGNLNKLTSASYVHQYYVDGSPTVGDAYSTFAYNCASVACWRTVLVSGLGGGGKGVFALDVTDPDGEVTATSGLAFTDSNTNAGNIVLWEFTDSATPDDMGHVFGQPTIARVRTGANTTGWVAIFGNGYNSTNGDPVLYVVNIKDGTLLKKITLKSDSDNGLSTPAVVDSDGDYTADYVFAGDLKGNLWKIALTNTNTANWNSSYSSGSPPAAAPLFIAKDANNNDQPITVKPEVGSHPSEDGFMVYFGTGRYIANGDNTAASSPVQTFYGIWDKNDYSGSGTPVARGNLAYQTISTATAGSTTVRQVTDYTITWGTSGSCTCDTTAKTCGTCRGWYDDLLTASSSSLGEKQVSNPVLLGGSCPRVIFTTLIPSSDVCGYGGSSWLMELDPTNGGTVCQDVFDITGDGTANSSDRPEGGGIVAGISPGIGIMPEPVILRDPANSHDLKTEAGSTGAITTIKNYNVGTAGGRQSWRQLK